ncbi:single-stranded DNA-binding protein [Robertmurraya andreesenii]|uniref:Single-stranded DNA-binding protein n=1 Tax=Anoxybacillus andreesenii TaxID=1325932 RepID=A0ABT9UZZ5_9BACL|nr:single-stranded DNA-binding protein [Robertmurraya andreesenii]MDQ0154271.1 single-strand DNA-binding protein [Robertmurraya andreesenii]
MINQVTLVGRLTKDPELKVTTEGSSVVNVTLAVNRNFRNQKGEIETDFVQCTIWRKNAENLSLYCKKGALIGITGRIQTRNYQNEEGVRKFVTEVIAESVRFIDTRRDHVAHVEKEVTTT